MQCKHAQDLLSDYIEGHLDRAMTVSIENHLSTCHECSSAVQGLRNVWTALDEMERIEVPLYFHENLMSRLEQGPGQRQVQTARWSLKSLFQPRSLAYMTAVLVVIATGLGVAHTEKASLDPVGIVMNMLFHSESGKLGFTSASRATWIAANEGGLLELHVQLAPDNSGAAVRGFITTDTSATLTDTVIHEQAVSSESESVLTLAVPRPETAKSLPVYLIQVQDDGSLTKTRLTLPLNFLETNPAPSGVVPAGETR